MGPYMAIDKRIGIIGAGKIGEAIIAGLLSDGRISRDMLSASDEKEERRRLVSEKHGIKCYSSNPELVRNSDVIIIAVRPNQVKGLLEEIREAVTPNHLIITIAAGVPIAFVAKNLRRRVPIIRAMTNTAVLVREGMTAIAGNDAVGEEGMRVAEEIFGALGKVVRVEEEHLNAVTGLSGSGPAYIYMVIEALTEGGVKVGLPREISLLLAAQTAFGAAKMVLETKEHPAKLRDMVTTPGGATIEGILQLEEGKIRIALINAVLKATERSKQLLME
ncbi:MAG: pyrroline-5-carboxylate reductase [Candidatus Bathyarchaeia archaeon]